MILTWNSCICNKGRKGWLQGWWRSFTNYNILFFCRWKNTGKKQRTPGNHRENTGNFVLIGAWQPWFCIHAITNIYPQIFLMAKLLLLFNQHAFPFYFYCPGRLLGWTLTFVFTVAGKHTCFVCKSSEGEVKQCRVAHCGKFYHVACISKYPHARIENNSISCPLHVCGTCYTENPKNLKCSKGKDSRPMGCSHTQLCFATANFWNETANVLTTGLSYGTQKPHHHQDPLPDHPRIASDPNQTEAICLFDVSVETPKLSDNYSQFIYG